MFMLTPNSLTLPPATVLLWEAGPAASEISDFHSDEVLVWLEESHFNFDIQVGVFLQESSLIVHRGDKWRCNRCGTYRQTNKRTTREDSATQSMDTGGLVPQHMIEESFRSSADGAVIASRFLRASSGRLVIGKIGRDQKNVEIFSQISSQD